MPSTNRENAAKQQNENAGIGETAEADTLKCLALGV